MKKWGKPREGVKLLARALRIEAEIPGSADNPAGTHVNMSAALSTLGFHRAAAAHAGHAIDLASQAMMRQEEESSFFYATEGGSIRTGDDATPGSVEVGGKAADGAGAGAGAVGDNVDVNNDGGSGGGGGGGGRGGGDSDPGAARVCGTPENGRDIPPLKIGTKDVEAIDSVGADDGRSPETSSSLSPTNDAGRGASNQEEKNDSRGNPENGADHQGVSSASANGEGDGSSSIERHFSTPSAAGGLLAIAYFNLGVEREYLGQLEAAISSYEEARVIADQHLGSESPVAKGIEAALEKASAALVAAARYSSKRAAYHARSAVSSFPSIGQLQFGQRTPGGVLSFGRPSPRRRAQLRQQHSDEATSETSGRDLLQRAYSSPRPYPAPAPPRTDSWGRVGLGPTSPRSPATASGSEAGGPQRAGRWTKSEASVVRPVKAPRSGRRGGSGSRPGSRSNEGGVGLVDEDLRWRALACAEWQCSPRDALHAQQAAHAVPVAPK